MRSPTKRSAPTPTRASSLSIRDGPSTRCNQIEVGRDEGPWVAIVLRRPSGLRRLLQPEAHSRSGAAGSSLRPRATLPEGAGEPVGVCPVGARKRRDRSGWVRAGHTEGDKQGPVGGTLEDRLSRSASTNRKNESEDHHAAQTFDALFRSILGWLVVEDARSLINPTLSRSSRFTLFEDGMSSPLGSDNPRPSTVTRERRETLSFASEPCMFPPFPLRTEEGEAFFGTHRRIFKNRFLCSTFVLISTRCAGVRDCRSPVCARRGQDNQ